MVIFAVQNGGWCAAANNMNGYRRYGKATNCRNGKGGAWANDVYRITSPLRRPVKPVKPAVKRKYQLWLMRSFKINFVKPSTLIDLSIFLSLHFAWLLEGHR